MGKDIFKDFNFDENVSIDVDSSNTIIGDEFFAPKIRKEEEKPTDTTKKEEEIKEDLIEISDEINQIKNEEIKKEEKAKKPEEELKTEEELIDNTTKEPTKNSPWKIFAKHLYEEGVISDFEDDKFEEDKGAQALIDLIGNEIKTTIDSYKEQYPEQLKRAIELYENGVPIEEIFQSTEESVQFKSITDEQIEENEDLQKALLRRELELRGYDKDQIDEEITNYEDLGKLEERAKKSKGLLINYQERAEKERIELEKNRREEEIKKYEEDMKVITSYVDNIKEIIPGNEVSKAMKTKIIDSMFKPVAKTKDGKPLSNAMVVRAKDPHKFDTIFHYLLINGVFEGKWDSISKVAVKKTVKDLEKSILDTSMKEGSLPKNITDGQKDLLSSIKRTFQ